MKLLNASLLATALSAAVLAPAHAADTQTFDVTISIAESCDVTSTENVSFGTNIFASAGSAIAEGDVVVQCTVDTAYNLALDGGNHSGNNINARQMEISGGTATIPYQLYREDARTNVWGETTGAGGNTETGTGAGFGTGAPYDRVHTVYAEATIPGTAPAGDYSDTITATITY